MVCEAQGTNRITGAGDLVRLATGPLLTIAGKVLPGADRVQGCGGCARRQRAMNAALPIRSSNERP